MKDKTINKNNLRVINTARDEESINKAAEEGFMPLIKKLEPLKEFRKKYSVRQSDVNGKIQVETDSWGDEFDQDARIYQFGNTCPIPFTYYYPYHFPSPFAAYLIPKDINLNERVFLQDLIEDYIGEHWLYGDVYRLDSCEAIWNGKDFDIQYVRPLPNEVIFVR